MVSKEQLYQQMSVLPQPRRNEEIPGQLLDFLSINNLRYPFEDFLSQLLQDF